MASKPTLADDVFCGWRLADMVDWIAMLRAHRDLCQRDVAEAQAVIAAFPHWLLHPDLTLAEIIATTPDQADGGAAS